MPAVKIDHILSFSSEDPVHTANNLLSTDITKKWKCKTPGEKNVNVVLQLEKASQITAIDIGNEHSAYVEVLASRSSNTNEFKVLLVTSAFMSPIEARQSQNVNKVRMFTQEQLSKPECNEKWDRIKIVCTQPFNKHVQFGLSFITLHSNEGKGAATTGATNIGKFIIRPESPDNLSVGSLFAKRKELKQDEKLTAAAAIRDATTSSSLSFHGSPVCKPQLKNRDGNSTPKRQAPNTEQSTPKDRNRNELFYTKDDEKSNDRIDKIIKEKEEEENQLKQKDKDREEKRKKLFDVTDTPKNKKKKVDGHDSDKKQLKVSPRGDKTTETTRNRNSEEQKRKKLFDVDDTPSKKKKKVERAKTEKSEDNETKKSKRMKPFDKLLEGVVLVISGIQNPERANLRMMALSMGAKYKADWDPTCTHLICAFPNTPKFNQVRGQGKIVKKSWVQSCHTERKNLPWRRYALDKNDLNLPESEDEIEELTETTPVRKKSPKRKHTIDSDDNEPSTSAKSPEDTFIDYEEHTAEGSDTEERVARILEQQKRKNRTPCDSEKNKLDTSDGDKTRNSSPKTIRDRKKVVNEIEPIPPPTDQNGGNSNTDDELEVTKNGIDDSGASTIDIFDADTDEEPDLHLKRRDKSSPDFFHGNKFYVDRTFDDETYDDLCKYIAAYNGKCVDGTDDVDIIVTTKGNSSAMKDCNKGAKCVKHKWILRSHNYQKELPIDDFVF